MIPMPTNPPARREEKREMFDNGDFKKGYDAGYHSGFMLCGIIAFLLLCMAFLGARDWGKQKYAEGYAAGVATQTEGEKSDGR
jgi:hypothetical protein